MAGLTTWAEEGFLNTYFSNWSARILCTSLRLGLFTTSPTDAWLWATPTGVEVAGNGYARPALSGSWSDYKTAPITFGSTIQFAIPTASWGTPTHWGLISDIGSQGMVCYGPITTPVAIGAYANVRFAENQISINWTGPFSGGGYGRQFLQRVLLGQDVAAPTNWYLGLFSSMPGDTATGVVNPAELAGGNYARVVIPGSSANTVWSAPSGAPRAITNNSLISFVSPSVNWGTATHWGLFDGSVGGVVMFAGALAASRSCTAGSNVLIPPGEIDITMD